jgi:hypothetical protein
VQRGTGRGNRSTGERLSRPSTATRTAGRTTGRLRLPDITSGIIPGRWRRRLTYQLSGHRFPGRSLAALAPHLQRRMARCSSAAQAVHRRLPKRSPRPHPWPERSGYDHRSFRIGRKIEGRHFRLYGGGTQRSAREPRRLGHNSSRASRMAAVRGLSPSSMTPPGRPYRSRPYASRMSRTRPLASKITAAAASGTDRS